MEPHAHWTEHHTHLDIPVDQPTALITQLSSRDTGMRTRPDACYRLTLSRCCFCTRTCWFHIRTATTSGRLTRVETCCLKPLDCPCPVVNVSGVTPQLTRQRPCTTASNRAAVRGCIRTWPLAKGGVTAVTGRRFFRAPCTLSISSSQYSQRGYL